jgi:hypothetical protein
LKSHKNINIEKMKRQYRHRYHPLHRQYQSNLENISTILELALTRVAGRSKTIHKSITYKASLAYEQLRYHFEIMVAYLELMMAKGLLDMDGTE